MAETITIEVGDVLDRFQKEQNLRVIAKQTPQNIQTLANIAGMRQETLNILAELLKKPGIEEKLARNKKLIIGAL
ncbi:MAG: hypothetical protein F9K23_15810 [Bacteroidetes bacterium]|nr:MAG: hypothetical protein F9K23_15810 [Bacteroidota bacterium]